MKISFDFDGTLTEVHIQETARSFIESGHNVWILTARSDGNFNDDLYRICEFIGLPKENVIYTNGLLKYEIFVKDNFDLHFDDEWDEVLNINNRGGTACLVNPDFEEIYMNMQYDKNNK